MSKTAGQTHSCGTDQEFAQKDKTSSGIQTLDKFWAG